jgi:hypothetical protein
MSTLPPYIGNEIFKFLIPDIDTIQFCNYGLHRQLPYKTHYEVALIGNKKIANKSGLFLSRISKKNGKHRYYITEEIVDVTHVEYNGREHPIYYYEYLSKYVVKNIDNELIQLLLEFE